jgi:Cupredoxin-like domain
MQLARIRIPYAFIALAIATVFWLPVGAHAQNAATVVITIKNHRFQPAQYRAPANRPITLQIRNQDPTPMEFESVSLRVEKVVAGNGQGTINLRPLSPGSYNFFDDFNPKAKGVLVVQ